MNGTADTSSSPVLSSRAVMISTARPRDGAAIAHLVRRAYEPYTCLIGGRPAPLDADYPSAVARGKVFLAKNHQIVGTIVIAPHAEHLLIENVAVDPASTAAGSAGRCSRSPSSAPGWHAFPKCVSTPTRRWRATAASTGSSTTASSRERSVNPATGYS